MRAPACCCTRVLYTRARGFARGRRLRGERVLLLRVRVPRARVCRDDDDDENEFRTILQYNSYPRLHL